VFFRELKEERTGSVQYYRRPKSSFLVGTTQNWRSYYKLSVELRIKLSKVVRIGVVTIKERMDFSEIKEYKKQDFK